jgi:hypothetical protein
MSKPTYDELVSLLVRIYKTSRIESVLDIEWANYPVEVFEEVGAAVCELTIEDSNDYR